MPDVARPKQFSTPLNRRNPEANQQFEQKRLQCFRSATNGFRQADSSKGDLFLLLGVMTQTKGPVLTSPFSLCPCTSLSRYVPPMPRLVRAI